MLAAPPKYMFAPQFFFILSCAVLAERKTSVQREIIGSSEVPIEVTIPAQNFTSFSYFFVRF
jgi:hypothetical protein